MSLRRAYPCACPLFHLDKVGGLGWHVGLRIVRKGLLQVWHKSTNYVQMLAVFGNIVTQLRTKEQKRKFTQGWFVLGRVRLCLPSLFFSPS